MFQCVRISARRHRCHRPAATIRLRANLDKAHLGNISTAIPLAVIGGLFVLMVYLFLVILPAHKIFQPNLSEARVSLLIVFFAGGPCLLWWYLSLIMSGAGVILGIIGLFQREQNKWIATVGCLLNGTGVYALTFIFAPAISPS